MFFLLTSAVTLLTDKIIMPFYVAHYEEVVVPDVQQRDFTDAKTILEKKQLAVSKKKRFDLSVPVDHVIQQIPEPQTTVKPGRMIELIVADHDRLINVPTLRLSTFRDARFNLESLGLKVGLIDSQSSNEFPAGIILEQSVEPNVKVPLGSAVNLKVSTGNNLIEAKVPYLVHKSLLEAKSMIVESGLRLGNLVKKYSPELLPGTIMEQSIDSSKTVAPLTPIDLIVSSTDLEDKP